MKNLLRLKEVAYRLRISPSTLMKQVRAGRLPTPTWISPRIPVWSEEEIDAVGGAQPFSHEVGAGGLTERGPDCCQHSDDKTLHPENQLFDDRDALLNHCLSRADTRRSHDEVSEVTGSSDE